MNNFHLVLFSDKDYETKFLLLTDILLVELYERFSGYFKKNCKKFSSDISFDRKPFFKACDQDTNHGRLTNTLKQITLT